MQTTYLDMGPDTQWTPAAGPMATPRQMVPALSPMGELTPPLQPADAWQAMPAFQLDGCQPQEQMPQGIAQYDRPVEPQFDIRQGSPQIQPQMQQMQPQMQQVPQFMPE